MRYIYPRFKQTCEAMRKIKIVYKFWSKLFEFDFSRQGSDNSQLGSKFLKLNSQSLNFILVTRARQMTIKLHFWYDYSKFFHLFSFCFIAIVNLIVRWNYKCLAMLFFSCIPALHWATAHKIFLPLKIRSKWFS